MLAKGAPPLWEQCWEAVRARVCAVCLDAHDDGTCGLVPGRGCVLKERMPEVVDVALSLESGRMDDYYAEVERRICVTCEHRGEDGHCATREGGRCALYSYLPLVLDALDEVKARRC